MKLSTQISKATFIITFFFIFTAFSISLIFQYNSFTIDKEYIQKELTEIKKENIKREVLKVHKFIDQRQELIQKKLKRRIKKRVEQAHIIATSIYEENKSILSEDKIKYLIVTTLKNISFSNKDSYVFINQNDSKHVLYNKQSKLNEKVSLSKLKDPKYNLIVKKQAKLVRKQESGYILNEFIKPQIDNKKVYRKLSFVKIFKPFDWHIGTGEYTDDIIKNTKNEILDWISNIRFGQNGYIFVNNLNQEAMIFDGKKLPSPTKYKNLKLYNLQIEAIKNKNDGFMFYDFKKLDTEKLYSKISYVKEYKKWNWIIGTGLYLDDIEKELSRKESILKSTINKQILIVLLIILLLTLLIYMISKKISKFIDKNIRYLINSFKYASLNSKEIDTKVLSYKEFEILGESLNRTLRARNKSESKLQDYIKIVNDNVIISTTDKKGIIRSVSKAFCEISGYKEDELIGKPHNIIRQEDVPKEFFRQLWITLRSNKTWSGEIKNKAKDGTIFWVDVVIHAIYENKEIIGYTAIKHNITDKKRVEYLSITDELTNLYNRRFFNKTIKEEINRAKREDYYLSFIMLDIDFFKKYNDTYGHHEGDIALKKVSNCLSLNANRASDFVFRLGGEEFGLLFSFKNKEESYSFANIIRTDIQNLQIKHKKNEVSKYITISLGLVVKKGSEIIDSDTLYKAADKALYKAKENGRNTTYMI